MSVRSDDNGWEATSPLTAGDILTIAEVARLLGIPASTVGDWARRGILPSRKLGRRRIFIRQHLEAVLLGDDA